MRVRGEVSATRHPVRITETTCPSLRIMPPGIVHQVFTPDPCLAIGGHAYSCHPVLLERAYKARLKEVTASSVTNQLGPHTGDLLLSMTWFYIKKGWEREDDSESMLCSILLRLDLN